MNDNERNGLQEIIDKAISDIARTEGDSFELDKMNLAEFSRRTGLSRSRARTLKARGFVVAPHGRCGMRAATTVISGFEGIVNALLSEGVTNSEVVFERIRGQGYEGGRTTVKNYIAAHADLVPSKRRLAGADPQASRGRRFSTSPGESYQMDWGFVDVEDWTGGMFRIACFAMVCHHCGTCYVEFFPNARQESLFIGMIHAFAVMGVPECVLTDNMKSVVLRRDIDGRPVWQADYAAFMSCVGFKTKLCKPRHPFTKGKVERLIRFVKGNFLAGRRFCNATDLNAQALEWCAAQSGALPQGGRLCSGRRALRSLRARRVRARDDPRAGALPVPPPTHQLRRVRQLRGQALRRAVLVSGEGVPRQPRRGMAAHLLRRPLSRTGGSSRDMGPQGQLLRRPVRRRPAGRAADGPRDDRHRPAGASQGKARVRQVRLRGEAVAMGDTEDAAAVYDRVSARAASLGVAIAPEELAELAVRHSMGGGELAALDAVFSYLADKRHDQVIETLLKLSRLPQKAPKTFAGFDFDRIRGRDAGALRKLPALANLHARKNLAFIGPGGIGKTHLAQAYGRECCLNGYKTYYLKATELRDKLRRAADSGSVSRAVAALVKPSCLIVDEVGRCTFDKACTDLFFDVVDRRYEKDCANTMILTSNTPTNNWDEFFTGDDTLLCTLDRLFDRASVFVMKGASFRGAELEIFSVETTPLAVRATA